MQGGHRARRTAAVIPNSRPSLVAAQEVWAYNFEEEMCSMRDAAEQYQYVALEVLAPRMVASPAGPFGDYFEYNYQMMRCNVDLTRALQVSLTLSDAKGNRPKGVSTWRFNFHFNPTKDFLTQDSLDLLSDINKHQTQGIIANQFGELLTSSGIVLSEDTKWISFCGTNGLSESPRPKGNATAATANEPPERRFFGLYSFGYLLQLLTAQELPESIEGFREIMDLYFPCRCDLAYYLQQLPHLSSRDPADLQKRPLFCSAHHCMDAFFRLPEAVRRTAFDPVEAELKTLEGQQAARLSTSKLRNHRRRQRKDKDDTNGSHISNGHSAVPNGLVKANGSNLLSH